MAGTLEPSEDIYYLLDYHPWAYGSNPRFNEDSSAILDLKNRDPRAIDYFAKRLDKVLPPGICVCVVPSHAPSRETSGILAVAEVVAAQGRKDCTTCLTRVRPMVAQHAGGVRSVETQLQTIDVLDGHRVSGEVVALLDDVVTSGCALEACRQLLLKAGAAGVICLAIGQVSR